MPRNVREWSHRKLDMASNNLDTAMAHIEEIRDVYASPHPEIAQNFDKIQQLLLFTVNLIDKVKRSY